MIASVYLPTIDPKDRFLGETQLVPQLVARGDLCHEAGIAAREPRVHVRGLNGSFELKWSDAAEPRSAFGSSAFAFSIVAAASPIVRVLAE